MNQIRINTSPFGCRWIEPGSEGRVGDFAYAVCFRVRNHDRTVSEPECARCPLWQESPDDRSVPPPLT